jgi:hypothetical protein
LFCPENKLKHIIKLNSVEIFQNVLKRINDVTTFFLHVITVFAVVDAVVVVVVVVNVRLNLQRLTD